MLAEPLHHRWDSGGHWRPPSPDKNPKRGFNYQGAHTVEYKRRMPSRRSCFLGFEMVSELVWDNWDLGREFTKTLIIKNTHSKLQRILFRPPVSKYFTSLARQKIVLNPETSFSIPITFKPLKRCDYEDTIEFQGKDDRFQVWLRAPAPRHAVEVPESVLLPPCAVQHSTHTTFVLKNVSRLTTFFHWESTPPFMLSPEQGQLKPGQEHDIAVSFHPKEALVHQQPVSCKFGTEAAKLESCCSVLLQGIAKYPYLEFKSPIDDKGRDQVPVLDFGGVAVGHTLHKHFEICNPSPVAVSFTLSRLSGGVTLLGSVFKCDVTSAEVAPGASLKATASFRPTTVDSTSVEYLTLICKGALNRSLLKLTGSCIGPQVLLSCSVVHFGRVDEGHTVIHTVKLVNSSLVKAVFQWDLDCSGHSVFCVQPASGAVPRQSHITLKVSYRPKQPRSHHRRVACLILNREPVFLDLVGNCHSEVPIKQQLQDRRHVKCGQRQKKAATVPFTSVAEYYQACLGGKDPLSPTPPLSVVPSELVFNQKMLSLPHNFTSPKPLSVTNHSKVKLRLEWTALPDSSFSVFPTSCEVPALKSTSFRVNYCPKQLNSFHGAQLECFAYPLQDNGLINESLLPFSLTVRVIGHSFQLGKKHSIPHCSLEPHLVEFPSVNAATYQAVLLQNKGDLPLTFHMNPDDKLIHTKTASLVMVPSCGLIQPHTHQILSLRTIPTEGCPKHGFNLPLYLNASEYKEKLTVISRAEQPCVCLEGDGKLPFQLTAINCMTQRLHQVRNLSRQALRFQWGIPEQDQGLISVEPDAGVLQPNESLTQTWSFTPVEEKKYTIKPILTVWPMQFPELDNLYLPLEVTGAGSVGYIEAKESVLEVGDVLIGGRQIISISLINNSPCSVPFWVTVDQKLLDKGADYDPNIEPCALQLEYERATLSSKCTILLQLTFRPHRKAHYMWTINYQAMHGNGSLSSPPKALCEVYAKGVFPMLQVADVCGSGSMCPISKNLLWKLLSLDNLNEHLQSTPCPAELTHRTPSRHSLHPTPPVFTKAVVDFSFSAAPFHSEPSTFMLMLYNPGSVPVEWAFLFPEDQQLDLEYWAETGEFSSAELYQMKVQDNHLFNVAPRSGKLMSGQQRAVTFTYSHDFTGTDRFPILFKMSYGREILLILRGVTLKVDRPYLHFASNTHVFTSVSIGDYNPPKQVYQLYNQGALPVHYEVDKAVISQMQEGNFNHPVLRCLSPDGEIPPEETAILEFIFSPLEAKVYQMDIPIHIQNGESTIVRFEGCGINSVTRNLSNPDDVQKTSCGQRIPFPGQLAFLSEDHVSFGDIVISSQTSKMLFLTNTSREDGVRFEWMLPQLSNQPQVLDIIPTGGSLRPGEIVHCVVNLTATKYPTIYQFDLVCKVTSEAALHQYHEAMQRMEEEKQRLKHEFTITDKALTESKVILREKEAEAVVLQHQTFINKYKTLPPIRASNDCNVVRSLCTATTRAERRALRELEKVQKDPERPKPCLMHLWVTAQSYGPMEFLNQSPDRLNRQYRPNQFDKAQRQDVCTERAAYVQGLKRDMSSHVLMSLLRDILEDSALVENLNILASTPVKYKLPETPPLRPSPEPVSSNKPAPQKVDLTEEILLCTLQNLMTEVMRGELDLLAPGSARSFKSLVRRFMRPLTFASVASVPKLCNRRFTEMTRSSARSLKSSEERFMGPLTLASVASVTNLCNRRFTEMKRSSARHSATSSNLADDGKVDEPILTEEH